MPMADTNEAYRNLAATIVLTAVNEYRDILPKARDQRLREGRIDPRTKAKQLELEEFFDSSWCGMLCGISGGDIKRKLQLRNC